MTSNAIISTQNLKENLNRLRGAGCRFETCSFPTVVKAYDQNVVALSATKRLNGLWKATYSDTERVEWEHVYFW